MNEATVTTAAPVADVQAGTIVLARLDGNIPWLAIVTGLEDEDTARVITPGGEHGEDLITRITSRACLLPAPRELDAAGQELARRLIRQLAAEAGDRAERFQSDVARLQQQADRLREKIDSMRAYAIDKHQDGTICKEGLNDFLAAHDLDLYQPRYSARVTISLSVEVEDADDQNQAVRMIRDHLDVSGDEDGVSITSAVDLVVRDVQVLDD